jgi:hypothetical protein
MGSSFSAFIVRGRVLIHDRRWVAPGVIFFLAFTIRLGIVLVFGIYTDLHRAEIHNIAISLAQSSFYGNAFGLTGPTAHYTPAYPLLLALIYREFGIGPGGELMSYVLNIALCSLIYSLLPRLSMALGLDTSIGTAAGIFGALFPINFYNEIRGGEVPLAATLVLCLSSITIKLWRQCSFSPKGAIAQGVLWGIAFLVSPSLLPVLFGFFIASLLVFRQAYLNIIVHFMLLIFTSMLLLVPWAARNYYALGSLIFFRSNLGLELQVSNNDLARATIANNDAAGTFRAFHPISSRLEADRLKYMGEVSYNSKKKSDALQWMWENPAKFSRLTFSRFLLFWFPKTTRLIQSILFWVIGFCAFGGLIILYRQDKLASALIGSIWLSFPNIYYVVQADTRYRYPIYWTFLLLGTLFIAKCGHSLRKLNRPT